jgi:uncharacterized protein YggE
MAEDTHQGSWISVTATGEETVAPDTAVVGLTVSGSGKELAKTRDDVNRKSSSVLARLREIGIAEADVQAPDSVIQPEYDHSKGQRLIGYRVARHVTVRVRELARLGDVMDAVVAAGANEVGGTQMSAADPSATEHAALARAVEAARAKAEAIATAAGVSLGPLMRVEEEPSHAGPPIPRMRMALAEDAGAPTEIAPGELTISRTIRAWFAIE